MLAVSKIIVAFSLLLSAVCAGYAGGRGGHNTTFDPNSEGGGWKFFDTDYGAVCDGNPANTATNNAAVQSWLTYARSQGAALVKLKLPPGVCVFNQGYFCADVTNLTNQVGVQNALIWAYGTTTPGAWFGGAGYQANSPATSALIQNANAGDPSVTLVTASDSTIFSVGDRIAVTAEATQTFGNPPSHSIFEYNVVTSITGTTTKVIGLGSPLKNSGYKMTFPQLGIGDANNPNQGGPATIYKMHGTWNTNCRILGLTVANGGQQVNIIGKENYLLDVTFTGSGSFAPSASGAVWLNYVTQSTNSGIEVDKNITLWSQYNSSVGQVIVQNGSVNQFLITGGSSTVLNGTSTNTIITNHKTVGVTPGPLGGGHGLSLILDGVTYQGSQQNFHYAPISAFSLNSGTLTIAKANANYDASTRLWVIGTKYYMGDFNGGNNCIPANTFTVTDIVDAGANVNIVTDIVSIPVTNICQGTRAPTTFAAYQSMSLIQKFSGPGNVLSNPEMLPP